MANTFDINEFLDNEAMNAAWTTTATTAQAYTVTYDKIRPTGDPITPPGEIKKPIGYKAECNCVDCKTYREKVGITTRSQPMANRNIQAFRDEYLFLSNFYPYANGPELVPGLEYMLERQAEVLWGYPTNENFYQAMKSKDEEYREKLKTCTAGEAKKAGRTIKLREDWEYIKIDVMRKGLQQKFSIPELMEALLDTTPAGLFEGNTWHDNYWGNCSCAKCDTKFGENNLGNLLHILRSGIA